MTGASLRSGRVQFRVPTAQLAAKLHRHPEVVLRWERRDTPVPRELADRYLAALAQCVAEGRTRADATGELTAVQVLREAGGQLYRQELIERIQGVSKIKRWAAVDYIDKAKQAGLIDSFRNCHKTVYRLTETAS